MNNWHPHQEMLVEYSAGNLPNAQSLCVSVHMHYCTECKLAYDKLLVLGSRLWEEGPPVKVSNNCRHQLMSLLDDGEEPDTNKPTPSSKVEHKERICCAGGDTGRGEIGGGEIIRNAVPYKLNDLQQGQIHTESCQVPKPLQTWVKDGWTSLNWQFCMPVLSVAPLADFQGYRVALHKIKAGGQVVAHTHRGTEVTVVLKGSFSDQYGHYKEGDFLCRDASHGHAPTASQDMDCICLTALEAPVKLTSWWGRVLNPFLR